MRRLRRLNRDLADILLDAAGALIDQFIDVGVSDPADIARRLNRRGFPCINRRRWTAAAVRSVLSQRMRRDRAA